MSVGTDWARRLGFEVPIVCAPMGGVAGGKLASAVSRAGALGMIGMGSAGAPEALSRELAHLDAAGRPFGVGFVAWNLALQPEMLDLALQAGPVLVSVSFVDWGDPSHLGWVDRVRASGAAAVMQVATAEEARRAEGLGVDAIVARGSEAGGHGDHQQQRDALWEAVREATRIPVLAAGGIAAPDDVRRVIERGAAAAWVGTAFSASPEALTSDAARAVLLAADGSDTVVTRVWDVALGQPWPKRFPERLIRTEFTDRWHGREAELALDEAARAEFRAASERGDHRIVPVDAGLGVGALRRIEPAGQIVRRLAGIAV